jgi:hypothetical protein
MNPSRERREGLKERGKVRERKKLKNEKKNLKK